VAEKRSSAGRKILIVEDDLDNRWVIARMLTGAGYTPLEASDGHEALEIALREQPALILMDLALPRMDGWEATRRIKAEPSLCDIPVLAVTAMTMDSDERQARAAGVDEYVTKPVRSSRIRAMVRRYLGD
jgi:two-component system, cell cycle response regulator DivK